MKAVRETKYEILRITGAIAITLSHMPCSSEALIINQYINAFHIILGGFGVNLFVLIGAWFLSQSMFKLERITRIILQMVFYGLLLDILAFCLGTPINLITAAKGFIYWFPFGYVVMLLFAPLVNKWDVSRSKLIICGGVIATLVTLIGLVYKNSYIVKLFSKGAFIGPVWFVYILIFTKVYKVKIERVENKIKIRMLSGIVFMLTLLAMFFVFNLNSKYAIREMYSPVCFICALSLFTFVYSIRIKEVKVLNKIAGASFGIYLFQCHRVFREYVWGVFDFQRISETSVWYFLLNIVQLIGVFLLGFVMDSLWNIVYTRIKCISIYKRFINIK